MPRQNVPLNFFCQLSGKIMRNPVVISTGHSYEKTAIEKFLQHHNYDPVTQQILVNKRMDPDTDLKRQIDSYHLCTDEEMLSAMEQGNVAEIKKMNFDTNYFNQSINEINASFVHHAVFDPEGIMSYVLSNGGNPNITDDNGDTPLHYAMRNQKDIQGGFATVQALLALGANPNAKNKQNLTPLHVAINSSAKDTYILDLLHAGANVYEPGANNRTPYDLAVELNNDGFPSVKKWMDGYAAEKRAVLTEMMRLERMNERLIVENHRLKEQQTKFADDIQDLSNEVKALTQELKKTQLSKEEKPARKNPAPAKRIGRMY